MVQKQHVEDFVVTEKHYVEDFVVTGKHHVEDFLSLNKEVSIVTNRVQMQQRFSRYQVGGRSSTKIRVSPARRCRGHFVHRETKP